MIVMDEDDCMVDIAKFYLGFTVDESAESAFPAASADASSSTMSTRFPRAKEPRTTSRK